VQGFAKYDCSSNKIPKKIRIAPSTMHDQMKILTKHQMVLPLKKIKTGKRPPKEPYTITDIGQIAWLRYFELSDNIEIVSKLFPNILLSQIDLIFNEMNHPIMKLMKDKFAIGILKIALNSYHTYDEGLSISDLKLSVKERIELTGASGLVTTSYDRWYSVLPPSLSNEIAFHENHNKLAIGIVDRVVFLFYYNLIQLVTNTSSLMIFSKISSATPDILNKKSKIRVFLDSSKKEKQNQLESLVKFTQKEITRKKSKMLNIITKNIVIMKIMKDNLKQLQEYKELDNDFQSISEVFLKI